MRCPYPYRIMHYLPVHLHPYYKEKFATKAGLCPRAEAAYERILSLPIFPAMSDGDVDEMLEIVHVVEHRVTDRLEHAHEAREEVVLGHRHRELREQPVASSHRTTTRLNAGRNNESGSRVMSSRP